VAGVRGRIVKIGNTAVPASYIEFDASRQMTSAIIGCMHVNPPIRSVINIRFNNELVKICKNLFSVSSYDRSKEPTGIKKKGRLECDMGYIAGALKEPESGHHHLP
jgi:predicted fused transcriptional regulator/phosphomethylpyrimidine kinase